MDILPQLIVNGLIAGSIYAIASSGLSLTYGLLRILNFAHGHFMMGGAYAFFMARVWWGCSIAVSGVIAATFMAALAFVSLLVFVRPFARLNPILPFVTTLALGSILEALVSIFFGVNVQSLSRGLEIRSVEVWGVFITPLQMIIIASALVVVGALAWVIHCTSCGRIVRALAENPSAAEALGRGYSATTLVAFTFGTLLAGYAGVLVGLETNIQPTMGSVYTVKAFAAMILGGLGNIWGTIVASYLLGLLENLSIGLDFGGYSLPAGYKDAFAFVLILGVLLLRPQGLFRRVGRRV